MAVASPPLPTHASESPLPLDARCLPPGNQPGGSAIQSTAPRSRRSARPGSQEFPKRRRILKSHDFRLVGRAGQRRQGELLVVEVLGWRNPRRPTQLGLTVSRKYGDAVQRNRFKRLVREAFRKHQHRLPAALGCVVSPRSAAHHATAAAIAEELLRLIGSGAPLPAASSDPRSVG